MIIRGIDFGDPLPMDAELPSSPGLYLVCTESSGGVRILGVYAAMDIESSFVGNEFRDEWCAHADNGLELYVSCIDSDLDSLMGKCEDIIDTRFYEVPCVKRMSDGW